jgi:long-chain acyl-CoA synthetase
MCGVAPGDLDMLRAHASVFVHAAAVTHLGDDSSACQRVNLAGTIEALTLAARLRTGALSRFLYFSTAFAPGSRQRYRSFEDVLPQSPSAANSYEWSKYHAELRVREAIAGGLPGFIIRPSIIVGHSETGEISDFRVIYPVIRLFALGVLRTLPARLDATLHVVPIDFVVAAAFALLANADALGRTFHVLSATPPTLRMLVEAGGRRHPRLAAVRVVPPEVFSRDSLAPLERSVFARMEPLLSYLDSGLTFDTRNADALLAGAGITCPPTGPVFLERLIDYAIARNYLPSTGARLAALNGLV